jgi:hypothetical protein
VVEALLAAAAAVLAQAGHHPATTARTAPPARSPSGAAPATTPAPATTQPLAGVGQAVRDGQFRFVVRRVRCGVRTIASNRLVSRHTDGQFCLVAITVGNVGQRRQPLIGASQFLVDADGNRRRQLTDGWLFVRGNGPTQFTVLQPGDQLDGVLVYELPPGATPARLELHDSPFSGGATVAL